jgi:hypothetical protein
MGDAASAGNFLVALAHSGKYNEGWTAAELRLGASCLEGARGWS